jgi:hypothetical protein
LPSFAGFNAPNGPALIVTVAAVAAAGRGCTQRMLMLRKDVAKAIPAHAAAALVDLMI